MQSNFPCLPLAHCAAATVPLTATASVKDSEQRKAFHSIDSYVPSSPPPASPFWPPSDHGRRFLGVGFRTTSPSLLPSRRGSFNEGTEPSGHTLTDWPEMTYECSHTPVADSALLAIRRLALLVGTIGRDADSNCVAGLRAALLRKCIIFSHRVGNL